MKAVLISTQPNWVEKIVKGEKIIEVRKTRPKLETPFKCYIYCTKDKLLHFWKNTKYSYVDDHSHNLFDKSLNGKVIGEFVCKGIIDHINPIMQKLSCLSFDELIAYQGKRKTLYGWHINDLKIYDTPKELSEFKKAGFKTEDRWLMDLYPNTHCHYEAWAKKFEITRPPQSWCYVEEL